ncbi:transmembrane and coiled-coil domain-containing protein 3 isoform X1 [Alosa sapidissima]|uniref:transmembrane and coiled-coil domain-containing protein 3 isoform X1 n=1 Tax=Alosa sapidissima TaxID=34773 RepID=UPI001C08D4A5|nr:transmembrane and coiled-coil domain-containing protein 3 isoform X1 [Alosa sapidissima]XP_041937035.1 transmembrane and coiled-coil domain-containing protein 3 isoform X1 [Alosa sapidissima]
MRVLCVLLWWVGLAVALRQQQDSVAQHAIKLYRGRGAGASFGHRWVRENCQMLAGLLRQKNAAIRKLSLAAVAALRDPTLSDSERLYQVHTLEVFQRELNESEHSVFQAALGLQRVLHGDYRDVVSMKHSSRQRLEALREAAIKEEREYLDLLAAEKHQQEALKSAKDQNRTLSILEGILEDVRKAADRLEEDIEEHAFDYKKEGMNVEAVLRVEDDEEKLKSKNVSHRKLSEGEGSLGLSMLIDSQNNQYVLTKPRDSTMSRADHHFIKDIILIVMLSLPCGWLCIQLGLPPMFGYIICGVLLGPSGMNSIKSMVQVESIGEFGVLFTLFVVGLEFSPEQLHKVWRISVQGTSCLTLLMVGAGVVWGQLLRLNVSQTVFVSSCLSLSSTPLVSKFLSGASRAEKEGELEPSSVLLGMLVMQDVQLGLFIAIMPTLIQAGDGQADSSVSHVVHVLWLLVQVLVCLAGVLLLCFFLRSFLIGPFYRKLHAECRGNKEIMVLGTTAFMFLMLMVTEFLYLSMELGCFLAGALVSSQGHMVTSEVMRCVEPIRDFLAIIFFASIGLHVFPTFVLYELTILLVLTLSLVILKFLMAVVVLSTLLPRGSRHICWLVSAGLAQVSEFSFVLGSQARRTGIISREVYLLVLSVTTLSLLLAPVLWWAARLRFIPHMDRKMVT